MPQMLPINWMILYLFFILTFLSLIINNYYFSSLMIKNKKTIFLKTNKLNWKW